MDLKMLYIGVHAILEFDEVSLFNELGIDVFCLGSYLNPQEPVDPIRPAIPGMQPNKELIKKACFRDALTKDFVDNFDVIYVMHMPDYIIKNWEVIKDKIVIWRSIGQSIPKIEKLLEPYRDNIKVIRYSPMEKGITGYIGQDAVIRFYKDPDEFKGWNGNDRVIVTFAQGMPIRGAACSYDVFETATRGYPRVLYGPKNQASEMDGGLIPYDSMKKVLKDSRVYFYTGTHPASYTLNFIESWMTGIPVVAVGQKYGNAHYFDINTYEVPSLIQNGINGFCSDDIGELNAYCRILLESESVAKRLSVNGRVAAIDYFGRDKIKKQWIKFFEGL